MNLLNAAWFAAILELRARGARPYLRKVGMRHSGGRKAWAFNCKEGRYANSRIGPMAIACQLSKLPAVDRLMTPALVGI